MKRKVTKNVIKARPPAAATTKPATVLLAREWPAVVLKEFADKTDCVDVAVAIVSSDERLVGATDWPKLSPE